MKTDANMSMYPCIPTYLSTYMCVYGSSIVHYSSVFICAALVHIQCKHKRHGTLASISEEHAVWVIGTVLDMLLVLLARRIHNTCVLVLSLSFAGLCVCCCCCYVWTWKPRVTFNN